MGRKVAARQSALTFADHIRELRTRFFIVAAIFLLASCLAYVFRAPILTVLLSPLNGEKLVYLNPAGGFNFILLISIYCGMAVSIPIFIHQLYGFLRPILPARTQHYAGRLFLLSLTLLVAGVAFGYFMAIPGALHFLYSFASDYVTASLTADSYLNFVIAYTIGLGIVFQLPLLLLFFHWVKPLTPSGLLKSQRWVVLLAFVAAAIITPTPDPLNQTVIAVPVIAVYQLGVFMVLIAIARQRKRTRLAAQRQAIKRIAKPFVPPAPVAAVAAPAAPKPSVATPRGSIDGFVVPVPRAKITYTPRPLITRAPQPTASVTEFRRSQSIDGMLFSA